MTGKEADCEDNEERQTKENIITENKMVKKGEKGNAKGKEKPTNIFKKQNCRRMCNLCC